MTALSIGQVVREVGLSEHTLRYYEDLGLVGPVRRSPGGRRRYSRADVDRLEFLLMLKATGMSLADIEAFTRLERQGIATLPERRHLLAAQRHRLTSQIDTLAGHLERLDRKIAYYRDPPPTCDGSGPDRRPRTAQDAAPPPAQDAAPPPGLDMAPPPGLDTAPPTGQDTAPSTHRRTTHA